MTVTLAMQAMRVLFPIAFSFGERTNNFPAAGAALLLVFLAPLLTAPLSRLTGLRLAPAFAAGALVAIRLVVQLVHPVPMWLAVIATVLALIALTVECLVLRGLGPNGGSCFALGVVIGLSLDTALRSIFRTWDYAWQSGPVPIVLTLVLGAALAVAIVRARSGHIELPRKTGPSNVLPSAALGPFLMLQLLFLQNVAFVASQGGLRLPAAGAVVLFGDVIAGVAAVWVVGRSIPTFAKLTAGAALVVSTFLLTTVEGPSVAVLVLAGQAVSGASLALAFSRGGAGERRTSLGRTSVAMAGAGFGFMLLTLLYQIHYQVPLPFPHALVPPVAGALLALATVGPVQAAGPEAAVRRFVAVPLALLVVPLGLFAAAPDVQAAPGNGESFRLVDYNVRSAVGEQGQLDPEAIARAIERQYPDVVTLQEVARGWPIAGSIDLAEWLSARLDMAFVYAPAADGQFGNAILSRLPILRWDRAFLPFGAGPQRRSYLRMELDLGGGRTVTVIDTHLQNTEGTPTRKGQIDALLRAWDGTPHTVIAGDMNVQPGDPDATIFTTAGFVSAQDVTGHSELTTSAAPKHPIDRVDWVFGTPDLTFSDFVIASTEASDHLPIAVTVSVT